MRSKQQEPKLGELLAITHSIGERAASQADQAEKDCKLADEIVEDINKARLIQVLQPKRFGGLEMGFPAMVRISQALAQHDMAASWIYSLFAIHHWWGALAKPEMQDEMWQEDPHQLFSDAFAPAGKRAVPVPHPRPHSVPGLPLFSQEDLSTCRWDKVKNVKISCKASLLTCN